MVVGEKLKAIRESRSMSQGDIERDTGLLRCYINRVAILEAILLSAYLGGAAASNVRAQTPLFNLSFPVMFAIVVWASLVLHNKRLESVLFQAEGGGDR